MSTLSRIGTLYNVQSFNNNMNIFHDKHIGYIEQHCLRPHMTVQVGNTHPLSWYQESRKQEELQGSNLQTQDTCLGMIHEADIQLKYSLKTWTSLMSHILSPVIHQVAWQLWYQSVAFQDEATI